MGNGLKVFVSSTFRDLRDHRRRVIDQLRAAGLFVDPMENWPADPEDPTAFCPDRVAECNLFILLLAFRRGCRPGGGASPDRTRTRQGRASLPSPCSLSLLSEYDTTDWPPVYDEPPGQTTGIFHAATGETAAYGWIRAFPLQRRPSEPRRTAGCLPLEGPPGSTGTNGRVPGTGLRTAHGKIKFLGLPSLKETPRHQGRPVRTSTSNTFSSSRLLPHTRSTPTRVQAYG